MLRFLKSNRLLFGLAFISLLALRVADLGVDRLEEELLAQNGQDSAADLISVLLARVEDPERLVGGVGASDDDLALLNAAVEIGVITRYKVKAADGTVVAASWPAGIGTGGTSTLFSEIVRKDEILTDHRHLTVDGEDHIISGAYVPIVQDGRLIGSIEGYVDLTDIAASHAHPRHLLLFGIGLLLLIIIVLVGWSAGRDVRRLKRVEQKLVDTNAKLGDRLSELKSMHMRLQDQAVWSEMLADEASHAKTELTDAIEALPHGFALWDKDGRLIRCNDTYRHIYREVGEILQPGVTFEELARTSLQHGVLRCDGDLEDEVRDRVARHENCIHPFEQEFADGRWIRISKTRSSNGGIVSFAMDVTERLRFEAMIRCMATTDELTGLANRAEFHQHLEEAIANAGRTGTKVGVMLLDLDGFKAVNDTLGHPSGDELLRQIAERLKDCARETDTLARLGGDEFGLVVTHAGDSNDVLVLAERILESLAQPYSLSGQTVHSGTSIGITIYPNDRSETDDLIRNADLALYRAKDEGPGLIKVYNDDMNQAAMARRSIEQDLGKAIENDQLRLVYQPLFDLTDGRVVGAEALLRWNHPDKGEIPPLEFIPVAESSRHIIPIGEWVMRNACRQARAWEDLQGEKIRVSVNVSPLQFRQNDLCEQIHAIVAEAGLEPERLEIEITESAAMEQGVDTLRALRRLKSIDIKIAIDDFGTGFSSLNRLKEFPVDRLKIDRTFVKDAPQGGSDAAICSAIIQLGNSLNVTVLAEGIETEDHLAFLCGLGCREGQGYLLSRPMEADAFTDFLRDYDPAVLMARGRELAKQTPDKATTHPNAVAAGM